MEPVSYLMTSLAQLAGKAPALLFWIGVIIFGAVMLGRGGGISFNKFFDSFGYYTYRINLYVVPFLIVLVPLIYLIIRRAPREKWIPSEKTKLKNSQYRRGVLGRVRLRPAYRCVLSCSVQGIGWLRRR